MTELVRNWAHVVDPVLQNSVVAYQEAYPENENVIRFEFERIIMPLVLVDQVDISGLPYTISWLNVRDQCTRDKIINGKNSRKPDLRNSTVTVLGGTILGMNNSLLFVAAAPPTEFDKDNSDSKEQIRTWGFDLDDIMLIDRSLVSPSYKEAVVSDSVYTKPLSRLDLYNREIETNIFLYDNPFGNKFKGYGYGRRC